MEIADGARTSVELALIDQDGPNGKFFHLGKELPWLEHLSRKYRWDNASPEDLD